ncbi:dihydroorotase [bacterium]|nr:dihydroorotase [bacterium]
MTSGTNGEPRTLTITRPDDWHLHLRDGDLMAAVLPWTTRCFARAVVMPNLRPPITTAAAAAAYYDRILDALHPDVDFTPLMTLYLTDAMKPAEIERAKAQGFVVAAKLYPAGATTNSDQGVTDLARARPLFEALAACGLPLLVHGEVTDPDVDIFDREAVFIERHLRPLLDAVPGLKVVLEHVTTRQAVEFVRQGPPTLAATITAHHLLLNRGAMFAGGLNPHLYCLPVLKREEHRRALVAAATGGSPRFFLGTDSAPHARAAKETACGCAGIFSAPVAMEVYATVFEQAGALDRLEGFGGRHGPLFYGLPFNRGTLTLERRARPVPAAVPSGAAGDLVPLAAGSSLDWSVVPPPAGLIRED